jgi:hypothetical protein
MIRLTVTKNQTEQFELYASDKNSLRDVIVDQINKILKVKAHLFDSMQLTYLRNHINDDFYGVNDILAVWNHYFKINAEAAFAYQKIYQKINVFTTSNLNDYVRATF